jgi:hypothetical protein
MKTKIIIWLIAFLAICLPVLAGLRDPETDDSKHLELAQEYNYTGQVLGTDNRDNPWMGSCVAIHDRIVLTAAHFMFDAKHCTIVINDQKIKAIRWRVHQDFRMPIIGQNDIAIVLVDKNIKLKTYPELYIDKNEINKTCFLAGFGHPGTFITGITDYDNKLRAGSNVVDYIDKGVLVCSPSKTHHKTPLEFLIAAGDSGGGLFIDKKLAGIHSAISQPVNQKKDLYLLESYHTRISEHIDWIESNKTAFLKVK